MSFIVWTVVFELQKMEYFVYPMCLKRCVIIVIETILHQGPKDLEVIKYRCSAIRKGHTAWQSIKGNEMKKKTILTGKLKALFYKKNNGK